MEVKKSIFSEISNLIFLIFTIFVTVFLWCNYYLRNFKKSLICSLILIITFCLIYIPYKIKKRSKIKSANSVSDREIYLKTQLLFSNDKDIMDFIIELYKYKNFEYISSDHLLVDNNTDIFINFKCEEIKTENIYHYYKSAKSNNINIITFNKPNITLKINNKTINYVDFSNLLKKCKENNLYFDNNIILEKKTKIRGKDLLCIVLGKHRSRSYLGLGLLILFSSLFTPYNIYYIIIASILFLLSIFSRFNKIFN